MLGLQNSKPCKHKSRLVVSLNYDHISQLKWALGSEHVHFARHLMLLLPCLLALGLARSGFCPPWAIATYTKRGYLAYVGGARWKGKRKKRRRTCHFDQDCNNLLIQGTPSDITSLQCSNLQCPLLTYLFFLQVTCLPPTYMHHTWEHSSTSMTVCPYRPRGRAPIFATWDINLEEVEVQPRMWPNKFPCDCVLYQHCNLLICLFAETCHPSTHTSYVCKDGWQVLI